MTVKLKSFIARLPHLTRGEKLVRNLLCCLLLTGVLWGLGTFHIPFPLEWRFRLAERANLVAPSEIVTTLEFADAIPWDADILGLPMGGPAQDQWFFSRTYGDERLLMGRHGSWLYFYGDMVNIFAAVPVEPEGAAVYLNYTQYNNGTVRFAALAVQTPLRDAAAVETELNGLSPDGGAYRLTAQGALEDGSGLLILGTGEASSYEPTPEMLENVLHLRLLDAQGNVIWERTGAVTIGGGWNCEN